MSDQTPDPLTAEIDGAVLDLLRRIRAGAELSIKDLTAATQVAIKWHESRRGAGPALGGNLGGGDDGE